MSGHPNTERPAGIERSAARATRRRRVVRAATLCLLAVSLQALALPLHEREIAERTPPPASGQTPASLPLGGHDDSGCSICNGLSHAGATPPDASPATLPLPPARNLAFPDLSSPERIFHPARVAEPRAPPLFS